jgi:tetratricopeptide (TPR) repeat protein
MSLDNLAETLRALGDYEQARELQEQALAMLQRLSQGDDPRIAESLTHLAGVLQDLGDHQRAQELHHQAAAMRQRLAAPPDTPRA